MYEYLFPTSLSIHHILKYIVTIFKFKTTYFFICICLIMWEVGHFFHRFIDHFKKLLFVQEFTCPFCLDLYWLVRALLLVHWKSKRIPEKHLLLLYWLCQSLWLCGSQQTEKFLSGGNTRLSCLLLRNLYARQEATLRTRHGTVNWFQIGKGVHQGCILSPCYLTYMQSASCEIWGWM